MSFLILLLLFLIGPAWAAQPQKAVVIVPVADVWNKTVTDPDFLKDEDRETQVLFGENVLVHESSGEWVQIEAIEQPTFRQHHKWEGYPGWMYRNALQIPPKKYPVGQDIPIDILSNAATFIGKPYLWGGLSKNGIDCSGLVHLIYRQDFKKIPRDAHEQWMKAKPIKRAELKPADLIFSAKADKPKTITHVALYAGDGQIIEAPQTGMVVRKISFKEKYGKDLGQVESGDNVGDKVIYFGSFLH